MQKIVGKNVLRITASSSTYVVALIPIQVVLLIFGIVFFNSKDFGFDVFFVVFATILIECFVFYAIRKLEIKICESQISYRSIFRIYNINLTDIKRIKVGLCGRRRDLNGNLYGPGMVMEIFVKTNEDNAYAISIKPFSKSGIYGLVCELSGRGISVFLDPVASRIFGIGRI